MTGKWLFVEGNGWDTYTGDFDGPRRFYGDDGQHRDVEMAQLSTSRYLLFDSKRNTQTDLTSLTVQLAEVAGESIVLGDVVSVSTSIYPEANRLRAVGMDATTAVIIYMDPTETNWKGRVLTLSGDIITVGAEHNLKPIGKYDVTYPTGLFIASQRAYIEYFSSTEIVFFWAEEGATPDINATLYTRSGTTLTEQNTVVLDTMTSDDDNLIVRPKLLTTNSMVVFYTYKKAAVGVIDLKVNELRVVTGTLTAGTADSLTPSTDVRQFGVTTIAPLSTTEFLIRYRGYLTGESLTGSISSNVVTLSTPHDTGEDANGQNIDLYDLADGRWLTLGYDANFQDYTQPVVLSVGTLNASNEMSPPYRQQSISGSPQRTESFQIDADRFIFMEYVYLDSDRPSVTVLYNGL